MLLHFSSNATSSLLLFRPWRALSQPTISSLSRLADTELTMAEHFGTPVAAGSTASATGASRSPSPPRAFDPVLTFAVTGDTPRARRRSGRSRHLLDDGPSATVSLRRPSSAPPGRGRGLQGQRRRQRRRRRRPRRQMQSSKLSPTGSDPGFFGGDEDDDNDDGSLDVSRLGFAATAAEAAGHDSLTSPTRTTFFGSKKHQSPASPGFAQLDDRDPEKLAESWMGYMDVDGDGKLSLEELASGFRRLKSTGASSRMMMTLESPEEIRQQRRRREQEAKSRAGRGLGGGSDDEEAEQGLEPTRQMDHHQRPLQVLGVVLPRQRNGLHQAHSR